MVNPGEIMHYINLLTVKMTSEIILSSCHLGSVQLVEYELILARAGFYTVSANQIAKMWICPGYRHSLGKFWSCQYPAHTGKAKQVKDRGTVGTVMAETVMQLYRTHIAVGSRKYVDIVIENIGKSHYHSTG